MLTISHIYLVIGVMLAGAAVLNARERRWSSAGFWGILAVSCLVGDQIAAAAKAGTTWPAQVMGAGVIALAVLASLRRRPRVDDSAEQAAAREASAARLGNRLFIPALSIAAITGVLVLGARFAGPVVTALIEPVPDRLPLVALGVAAVLSLIMAIAMTRSRPVHGLTEGRRLLDTIGWPVALPMLLATLGAVFDATGVGAAIAALVTRLIPTENLVACLLAFGLGMVAFTAIMGNAFAAFPVMMAGIGLPFLIQLHGGRPAALGALGMLTGYCGTLVTPMAANFNVVPVLLLDLRDPHAVIRAQWPTALALLITNFALMSLLAFR